MQETQLILISGFLGAGKTTLLRNILESETKRGEIVVIVNEFGEIGIDGSLITGKDMEVIELTSGCICCTMQSDLLATLPRLKKTYNPEKIIIEASGVADPVSILPLLQDEKLLKWLKTNAIITVLDGSIWQSREVFGELLFNQLKVAGIILLNKIDTVSREEKSEILLQLGTEYPDAVIIPTTHCEMDLSLLWDGSVHNLASSCFEPSKLQQGLFRITPEFSSYVYTGSEKLDPECLARCIRELPETIVRVKGPFQSDGGMFFVNYAGGAVEFSPWSGSTATTLVLIGWGEALDGLAEQLDKCRC
jgi:G3E family GTPase